MTVITTASLEEYLNALFTARTAILNGKTMKINGKEISWADEKWISSEIKETEGRLNRRVGSNFVAIQFHKRNG